MDPTANLAEQLSIANHILDILEECDSGMVNPEGDQYSIDRLKQIANKAERLAELVLALGIWIKRGGFLPEQWRQK